MVTGGLFNTTLRGTGWVALTTDGPPVVLNAAEAPTFADTNAVVAWSSNLQTQLKTSFKAGALIDAAPGGPSGLVPGARLRHRATVRGHTCRHGGLTRQRSPSTTESSRAPRINVAINVSRTTRVARAKAVPAVVRIAPRRRQIWVQPNS